MSCNGIIKLYYSDDTSTYKIKLVNVIKADNNMIQKNLQWNADNTINKWQTSKPRPVYMNAITVTWPKQNQKGVSVYTTSRSIPTTQQQFAMSRNNISLNKKQVNHTSQRNETQQRLQTSSSVHDEALQ